jgi:Transposase DNA-binding/Transposase DDE domain
MEVIEKSLGEVHFGAAALRDARLTERLVTVANQLIAHPNETFPKKFQNPSDLQAFYRLMKNAKVTHASVLAAHRDVTQARMRATPGVVLAIQDTTALDYSGLDAIADLAPIGNGNGRGYSCHNCLAVVAQSREVLGLAAQVLHRRRQVPKGEKRAARQQHPQRESRLWKTISQQLPAAPTDGPAGQLWVDVADRGADITEFLDYEEEVGKKYLVRSQHNRWIERKTAEKTEKIKLHELARTLPAAGSRPLKVQEKPGQPARTTAVRVSWQAVTLVPPRQRRGEERGVPLATWVVRVWEEQPPAGVKALEWILLTNVPVQSLAEAFERIDWYSLRWIIEEYHKAQKTGCDIEKMQFSYRARLEPAIALLSIVAVMLLNLRDHSRAPDAKERPATDRVPALWVRILSKWRHGVVRTDWSVHDFYYALARLGGHQNRKHDHAPGWLVLWRGWLHLQAMLEGAAAVSDEKM